jgi:formyl-CoA transferase
LQSEAGRANLHKLIRRAHALLDNYRPGVLVRLGLDDATLSRLNPGLIRCSITGFGDDGPYRDRPAYDSVGIAMSGLSSLLLDPAEPDAAGPTIADNVTGMYVCYGILGALVNKVRSGKGARVDVNMLESTIAFIPDSFANFTRLGIVGAPHTRVATSQSYAFLCADDRLIAVHLSSPDKFWRGLLSVIERPELAANERFRTRDARVTHYNALKAELAVAFRTRPRIEWCSRLEAQDVPHAPIWSVPEVLNDPQVRHLGTFCETRHDREGRGVGIHRPVLIDGERGPNRMAAPSLGEHSAAIAREFGLT